MVENSDSASKEKIGRAILDMLKQQENEGRERSRRLKTLAITSALGFFLGLFVFFQAIASAFFREYSSSRDQSMLMAVCGFGLCCIAVAITALHVHTMKLEA